MPGPKATNRTKRADTGSTDRKARARLAKRHALFVERNTQNGQQMHKPGSENRKK